VCCGWTAISGKGGVAVGERDAIAAVFALAAGELSEDELADWFRERLVSDDR